MAVTCCDGLGSLTVVTVGRDHAVLVLVRVRVSAVRAERLEWAARWPARAWELEGAADLGHLLPAYARRLPALAGWAARIDAVSCRLA
jgi:hypothetical protein